MKTTITVLFAAFIILICNFTFNINNCHAQWVPMQNGMSNAYVHALAVNGNNIFAGTYNPGNGVYLSTDNGTNWTQTSLNNQNIFSLAVNGNNIFAGTYPNSGLFLSTDNGTSWNLTSLNNQSVFSLTVNGNNIFAGTIDNGVYLSTNNGTSWTQTSLNNQTIRSLAVNGNNIFAGTGYPGISNGVYLSTNNGTTWNQTSLTNINVYSLAVNGNSIFAGTSFDGIYISTNNGTTWNQTSLNNQAVWSFAFNGNYIIAATGLPNSIYVSSDNGTSWIIRNDGIPYNTLVYALCLLNNNIYAGTGYNSNTNGVYKRPLGELTSIKAISNSVPQQFSLSQNYPNPFNPTTKINFNIPKTGFVSLTMYDALGRKVETLINQQMNPGSYSMDFNGSELTSGVYFYRLQSADFTDVKKLVLLK